MATTREYKLSADTAAQAVGELLDYYDVLIEELPDDQRTQLESVRAKLVRYYREGLLESVREAQVLLVRQHLVQPPGEVKDITYGRMTGQAKLAMDGYRPTQFYARVHALMGALSGLGDEAIRALSGRDQAVMECLSQVFLVG